jgi:hypothetical protein
MRLKLIATMGAAALLATACGSAQEATTRAPTAASPTTLAPAAAPVAFAYSYESGDRHEYAFDLEQNLLMTIEAEGDESLLGDNPPGDINVTTSIAGKITYDITDGPSPDTRQISISGVFDDVAVNGTIDGEPLEEGTVDEGTIPDLISVPDVTIVIDELGRLVSVDGEEAPEDMASFGDPFAELENFTSGGLGGHFGPQFPEEPLEVGDTWSFTQSDEVEGLDTVMSVTSIYTVTGTETLGGHEVAVIEFTTETSEVVLDLGAMFQALFDAFGEMGSDLSGETTEPAEIPDITFLITVAPSTAAGTVWFDQEAGIVAKFSQNTITNITMLMDLSDAESVARTAVTMDLGMHLAAEKVDGPAA